ncbi:hypothetical protein EVAR_99979_1 [Eumeta japonica]|uniref:Uncharacterized protein n=1 Tax=Eumeta variegata TaxID=151549 RepID=A0A4C1ZKL8_EUMVA|nr:hypothetical protein EVAR_99979_1 [Eumeta japonica]
MVWPRLQNSKKCCLPSVRSSSKTPLEGHDDRAGAAAARSECALKLVLILCVILESSRGGADVEEHLEVD